MGCEGLGVVVECGVWGRIRGRMWGVEYNVGWVRSKMWG